MATHFGAFFANPQKHVKAKPAMGTKQPVPENPGQVKRKSKEMRKKSTTAEMNKRIESGMKGSKFRWINEQLYTTPSKDSFKLLKKNKGLFSDYHEGYSQMVDKWPKNPLDLIIKELKKDKYKGKTIIDLGCGTGRLAKEVISEEKKVLSFDFVALNPLITECDITHLPLKNSEVDVAVFCLSLMGKNYLEFIAEANRCLKTEGEMIIAEVTSRVSDLKRLVKGICLLGFKCVKVAKCEDYFVMMMFTKIGSPKQSLKQLKSDEEKNGPLLQPCHYKKR